MFTVRYLNTPHEEVTWKVRRFLFEHLVYSLFDSRLFCRCWLLSLELEALASPRRKAAETARYSH